MAGTHYIFYFSNSISFLFPYKLIIIATEIKPAEVSHWQRLLSDVAGYCTVLVEVYAIKKISTETKFKLEVHFNIVGILQVN